MSTRLPDYSEWLTHERFKTECEAWHNASFHQVYAEAVEKTLGRSLAPVVLELGCGIGLVPAELRARSRPVVYYGVDANLYCLQEARRTNPEHSFIEADIRDVVHSTDLEDDFDIPQPWLVCSFAVLKHFAVQEARELLERIIRMSSVSVFSIPVDKESHNDGVEFEHSWLDWLTLNSIIGRADKLIDRMTDLDGTEVSDEPTGIEVVISCSDRRLS
jgi:SAM-dependent methyltransferase